MKRIGRGTRRHCNEEEKGRAGIAMKRKREGHSQALEEKGRGDLTALLPLFSNPNKR